jgi:hypothetical protein
VRNLARDSAPAVLCGAEAAVIAIGTLSLLKIEVKIAE